MKILLAGDSWGVGEWGPERLPGRHVSHLGLEQYLRNDGHDVDNVSIAGGCLQRIAKSLLNTELEKYDYIFVFVTDTFRSLGFDLKTFWSSKDDIKKVKEHHQNVLHSFLHELNSLNKKIVLLGALTKVTKKDVKGFKNLTVGISSIIELLIPGYTQHEICFTETLQGIPRNIDKELFEYVWEQSFRWTELQDIPIFYPDGGHPNREGHKKIFIYLKEKFQL
jgi:hypothetical protein